MSSTSHVTAREIDTRKLQARQIHRMDSYDSAPKTVSDIADGLRATSDGKLLKFLVTVCLASSLFLSCGAHTREYLTESKLFDDKLGPNSGYRTVVRPLRNLSEPIKVNMTFHIVAIVEVNAITQRFIVNGFVGFNWLDEMLAWNMSDYQYTFSLHPDPKQIWRPRTVLANTVVDRDLFQDNYSPIIAYYTGHVTWFPGSLFPTSCKLNMYKFPFDVQTCTIHMLSNGYKVSELQFVATDSEVDLDLYVPSGEWQIERSWYETNDDNGIALFKVYFQIRRLPGFFVINIVTPIVLMSFLNILVFLIPVESGEKIGFGITVLLALALFMSIVSEQLPRTSDTVPLVNIYLLVLTSISVATVIVSIITVYIHHRDEQEVTHQKAASSFQRIFNKVKVRNQAASQFNQVAPKDASVQDTPGPDTGRDGKDKTEKVLSVLKGLSDSRRKSTCPEMYRKEGAGSDVTVNRWRQLGKYLDTVSFVVFMLVWVSVTIAFLVAMAS